jgi:NADPH:quinone reductase-like Zn-dependent oxidoreductase
MRAMVIAATGAPDVFTLVDLPMPSKVNAEMIVKIIAAGVNPIDAKTRSGGGYSAAIENFPAVLGADFSGIVVESSAWYRCPA